MNLLPIIDGHDDTLTSLYFQKSEVRRSFFEKNNNGHIDLPRAKMGGLACGFFAIYTPPPESSPERDPNYGLRLTDDGYDVDYQRALEYAYANDFTKAVLDFAQQLETESENKIKIVRNIHELESCIRGDSLGMILHIEGAEAIKSDLSDLEKFYRRGIRSLGMVWSRPNDFGYGVPYKYPHSPDTGPGLTKSGKNLVTACNELGIIIDLAHLNENGFFDVVKFSKHPLIVSHAAVHALCPSTRNITDRQIDAIKDSGGVIGIWFEPMHLNYKTSTDGKPIDDVPLAEIVRHFDYIANRVGIDHVAIGSDFDGANMPSELCDVSQLPKLIEAIRDSGYGEEELEKIAYKNWLRVIKATWAK